MRTSSEFVEILENYLKEKKISRRQFCALVDIPNTTISSWKSKNILPSIELVAKIAKFINVSLDWLVYGDLVDNQDNTYENPYSRRSILYRIEIVLRQKNMDYDYNTESLYNKYLKNIVDYEVLINWVEGRANIAEDVLPTHILLPFALPIINIILTYLAIRAIGKDEALVRSLDRLR